MIKSNPNLLSKPSFFMLVFVESFDSSFEKQVSDPDEFDFLLMNFSAPVILSLFLQTLSPLLIFASEVDLLIINPRALVL